MKRSKYIGKIYRYIIDKNYRVMVNTHMGWKSSLSDEEFLRRIFKVKLGYDLNLENPKTFNEKLQWLKLHDRNPLYTTLVDKYEVKKWVAERIGEEYIIPTLGVYNEYSEIDFDALPNQFVMKCTHDSGGVVIVKDKTSFNKKFAEKKLRSALKRDFYLPGREWPYKNVARKIIVEKFMCNEEMAELIDYKLMCFNGKVLYTFVCSERFSSDGLKVTFFDNNWNVMPFERHYPKSQKLIPKPKQFSEMIKIAETLAANIPFVRVDLYDISGQIYFGEMTFYPGSGFEEFNPKEWDEKLGKLISL